MSDKNLIGSRIKQARSLAGVTQQELADALEMSRTNITHMEKGRHQPQSTDLVRIANYLNVSVEWLVSGNGEGKLMVGGFDFKNNKLTHSHGSFIGNQQVGAGNQQVSSQENTQLQYLAIENDALKREMAAKDETIKELRERIVELKERVVELKESAK